MKVIIADTSSLILYDKIQRLDILQHTFPELIVTKEVADEYGELPDWIVVKEVSDKAKYAELTNSLGKGEASSIALALESGKSLLIIDEKKGRKIAENMEIEIIGSLGILIKAKERGVVKSVEEVLQLIDRTDFRISPSVREKILNQAGEK